MGKHAVVGYLLKHGELVSPGVDLAGIGVSLEGAEGATVGADLLLRKGRIYYAVGAENTEDGVEEARRRILQFAASFKAEPVKAKLGCEVIVPVVAFASS